MNKQELVSSVSNASGLTKSDAEKAVDATFASISTSLQKGEAVRLVGFGTFDVAQRAESEGRNPRTGEKITIPARRMPKFRPGKQLKDSME